MFKKHLKDLLCSRRSLLYALFIYLCFLGFHNYVLHEPRNECEMTFMFQTPEFISVPLKPNVTKRYPNYSLFVYGEGAYAMSWQYPRMENSLTGIPVLFVPGNGGSYKQVRSFGSISLRMADDLIAPFNFDFFTINYNEELSALSGEMLQDQTEFLYESIEAIKHLYLRVGRNVSLIMIGHSVGGLLCRAVFSFPEFTPSSVDLLITLAAPHQKPVLPIDTTSVAFYADVNKSWQKIRGDAALSHLTVISIGGGIHDKLVRSHLVQLPTLAEESGDLSLVSTHIPDVWVSVDHLCIVWCRQLIIKLVRLLFDLIPKNSNRITKDLQLRKSIIKYHLTRRNRERTYPTYFIPEKINIPAVGHSLNAMNRFYVFQKQKVIDSHKIMIPLVRDTVVFVLTSGLQKLDWLIACNASIVKENNSERKTCNTGLNLSPNAQVIPGPSGVERKFYAGNASHLIEKGLSHLLVYVSPSGSKLSIYAERFLPVRRNREITMPWFLSMFFSPVTVVEIPVTEESIYYNFTLAGVEQIWHAYLVRLEVVSCYPSASEPALLHFSVPWNNEDSYSSVRAKKHFHVQMFTKLNMPKPSVDRNHARLELTLDPNCGYRLKMKLSLPDLLGQVYRHYYPMILPWTYGILLSVLSMQVQPQDVAFVPDVSGFEGVISTRKVFLPVAMLLRDKFLVVSLLGFMPATPLLFNMIMRVLVDEPNLNNYLLISEGRTTFTQQFVLCCFLYATAYCVIYILSVAFMVVLHTMNKVFLLTQQKIFGTLVVKEASHTSLKARKLSVLIFCISFGAGLLSCSTIGYLIAILLSFLHLVVISFKSHKVEQRQGPTAESTQFIIYLTILLIMLVSIVPTVPSGTLWFNQHLSGAQQNFTLTGTVRNLDESLFLLLLTTFWEPSAVSGHNKLAAVALSTMFKCLSILAALVCSYSYSYILTLNVIAFTIYNCFHFVCFCCNRKHVKSE